MSTTKVSMREEALRLASLGFRVFPLHGKIPIGGRGCHDASSDELQIESWWEQHPDANIGIATGYGIAALDVDYRAHKGRDGRGALQRLVHTNPWPKTVTTKTGSGGRHYFFGVTKDMWVPNSKDNMGKGIELLYNGRYVVAPPSMHPRSKRRYEWLRDPWDSPCAEIPQWLVEYNIETSGRSSWDRDKYVEEMKEGEGRNPFLASYAGALRRQGSTVGEIYDALMARNNRVCSPPLSEKEVGTIARSIVRYEPEDLMVSADFTDMGNGERFASYAKGAAIFVPGTEWHTWTGRRWRQDEGQIQEVGKRVVREIKHAAIDQGKNNEELAKRLKAWYMRSSSMASINNMITIARTHPDIHTDVSKVDSGKYRINVENGTLDLRTGKLEDHRASDLLTRLARAPYDPEAECPKWNCFLEEILPDPEIRDYIQRAIGYTLCGDPKEQCFFLMYGTGSNGKSTFIQTIFYMLGNYSTKVATSTIMGGYRASEAATPGLVRLRGPRFAVAAESGDGSSLDEATIKDLTGEDTIVARPLYKPPVEFAPQLKLWLYSNYKPTVKGMDHGIWRRIRLIPFTARITSPNKSLPRQLRTELPGIFNWAYRGFVEWEKFGLLEPELVRAEADEYRAMMDVVAEFIAEKCKVDRAFLRGEREDSSLKEPLSNLWEAFSRWQSEVPRNERIGRNRLYERLVDMGYPRGNWRVPGGAGWQVPAVKGLRLHV